MIDQSSKVPLYHQVYESLRGEILGGKWEPGTLLAAEPELVNQYKVSRITIRQALDLLAGEGLIVRQRGRGTFVAAPSLEQAMVRIVNFTQDMQQRGMRSTTEVLSADLIPAPPHIAQKLDMQAGEELVYLERLRLADGTPLAIEESHLVHRHCEGLLKESLHNCSLRELLDKRYGIRWLRAKQVIRAIQASPEIARHLEVPTGDPLLHIERVSYSQQNVPVEFLRVYYRGDRYSLFNELQA
jgi:GntR family transcriptional regulator